MLINSGNFRINLSGTGKRNSIPFSREYREEEPEHFEAVQPEFLYKGGSINNQANLSYLSGMGIRTIICLLDPKDHEYFIQQEQGLIKDHNKQSGDNLKFVNYSLFKLNEKMKTDEGREEIKKDFKEIIKRNEAPFYMHCLFGSMTSLNAEEIFRKASHELARNQ